MILNRREAKRLNKIPNKDAERILNHLTKAKEILRKYDEDEYGGMIDCYCEPQIAYDILDQIGGYETLFMNSKND
jgi:hypothetical protein